MNFVARGVWLEARTFGVANRGNNEGGGIGATREYTLRQVAAND